MSKIFKVSTVTRIAGVLVTILVNVTDFVVADVKRSQVSPVTERVGILITVSVTVIIFNVANLKCANVVCVLVTSRKLSLFLMLQIPQVPDITRMVHVPHEPEGERSE